MAENSLFEILGILIGFAGIMLVLSLLVTAATQSVLYWFNIRARNLEKGLKELLATAKEEGTGADLARSRKNCEAKRMAQVRAKATVDSLNKRNADPNDIAREEANLEVATIESKEAKEKLEAKETKQGSDTKDKYDPVALAKAVLESNGLMNPEKTNWLSKMILPKTSWILKDELEIILHDNKDICAGTIEKVMSWYSRMERGLSQSFGTVTRYVAIVCALIVACVFQVSAPDVLKRLSTDSRYRAEAEMTAASLLNKYEGKDLLGIEIMYENVSAKALEQLQGQHPDLEETLEEVSGIGRSKADILNELSIVLEDNPQRENLVKEYESILVDLHNKGYEQSVKMMEEAVGALALFDIVLFSGGAAFYWNIQNVLGILMTTVLISLGAPFWFNTLQNLVNLRDTLAPKKNKKAGNQASETQID